MVCRQLVVVPLGLVVVGKRHCRCSVARCGAAASPDPDAKKTHGQPCCRRACAMTLDFFSALRHAIFLAQLWQFAGSLANLQDYFIFIGLKCHCAISMFLGCALLRRDYVTNQLSFWYTGPFCLPSLDWLGDRLGRHFMLITTGYLT